MLLACRHRGIPRLSDRLPAAQRQALADAVKTPLLFPSVRVPNWQPRQRAGIGCARAPSGFWAGAELGDPVSRGGVRFPRPPDEPMLLHLGRFALARPDAGSHPGAQSAIPQAAQAVQALLPRARLAGPHPVPGPDPTATGLGRVPNFRPARSPAAR